MVGKLTDLNTESDSQRALPRSADDLSLIRIRCNQERYRARVDEASSRLGPMAMPSYSELK